MPAEKNMTRELALLLTLATLWGAAYTLIKIGVATIPPITLITARTFLAATVLLIVLRIRGLRLPRDAATWKRFFIQACLNTAVPFTLIAWAETTTDAGLAVILNSTTPVFAFLMTVLFIRQETISGRKAIGIAAGFSGIVLIVGVQALNGAGKELLAQFAVVAASVCYAGAVIFGKNFKGLDPMMPAAGSLLCGAIILAPLSLVIDQPWTLSPSTSSLLALVTLSVFSTALAFVIYFRLINTLGSVGTTAQAYLRVPIGVGIGVVFLGESLSSTAWVGLFLVVGGVFAMTLPAKKPVQAPVNI